MEIIKTLPMKPALALSRGKAHVPKIRFKGFAIAWESKSLSSLTSKISDGLHSTPKYQENGEYYFVNGNNLINGQIYFLENTKRVSKEEYIKHKKDLSNRTILISINGTIGSLALYNNEQIILGKSACYINVNLDTDKYFIYNSLQTPKIKNFFTSELTGSTIKNLSLTTIKNCEFAIPTLPEQQKIASFLSAVDEKIQQLNRKKELLESYKKGVMQQLFSGKLRFKDENGKAFPKWEQKKLGDFCTFFSGGTPASTNKIFYSGTIPFIGSGNIYDSEVSSFITKEALNSSSAKIVEKGDLLYALYGANSGEVAISKIKGAINQAILCIRCDENIDYLYYVLLLNKNRIVAKYLQGGQGNLSANIIKRLKYKLPTLEEQKKIANYLSNIDTKIEILNNHITQTQNFKKGLLQQMFV